LLPLYVNVVSYERIDHNGEVSSSAPGERQGTLLPVHNPGRPWPTILRHRNLNGSNQSMVVPASGSTHPTESDIGRQRKNQCVRQKNIGAIEVLRNIPNVPPHLSALVADQSTLLRPLHPRDIRDLQDLFARE
jgi:hypothetical protein